MLPHLIPKIEFTIFAPNLDEKNFLLRVHCFIFHRAITQSQWMAFKFDWDGKRKWNSHGAWLLCLGHALLDFTPPLLLLSWSQTSTLSCKGQCFPHNNWPTVLSGSFIHSFIHSIESKWRMCLLLIGESVPGGCLVVCMSASRNKKQRHTGPTWLLRNRRLVFQRKWPSYDKQKRESSE